MCRDTHQEKKSADLQKKADLHDAILSHAASLRLAYETF